jgi:hypothetical protein
MEQEYALYQVSNGFKALLCQDMGNGKEKGINASSLYI